MASVWMKPSDCPKGWEGRYVWEWQSGATVRLIAAPFEYSRVPEHSVGIWWMLADVPAPPVIPCRDETKS